MCKLKTFSKTATFSETMTNGPQIGTSHLIKLFEETISSAGYFTLTFS